MVEGVPGVTEEEDPTGDVVKVSEDVVMRNKDGEVLKRTGGLDGKVERHKAQ